MLQEKLGLDGPAAEIVLRWPVLSDDIPVPFDGRPDYRRQSQHCCRIVPGLDDSVEEPSLEWQGLSVGISVSFDGRPDHCRYRPHCCRMLQGLDGPATALFPGWQVIFLYSRAV